MMLRTKIPTVLLLPGIIWQSYFSGLYLTAIFLVFCSLSYNGFSCSSGTCTIVHGYLLDFLQLLVYFYEFRLLCVQEICCMLIWYVTRKRFATRRKTGVWDHNYYSRNLHNHFCFFLGANQSFQLVCTLSELFFLPASTWSLSFFHWSMTVHSLGWQVYVNGPSFKRTGKQVTSKLRCWVAVRRCRIHVHSSFYFSFCCHFILLDICTDVIFPLESKWLR